GMIRKYLLHLRFRTQIRLRVARKLGARAIECRAQTDRVHDVTQLLTRRLMKERSRAGNDAKAVARGRLSGPRATQIVEAVQVTIHRDRCAIAECVAHGSKLPRTRCARITRTARCGDQGEKPRSVGREPIEFERALALRLIGV